MKDKKCKTDGCKTLINSKMNKSGLCGKCSNKKYRDEHEEEISENGRKWREKNPEKFKEYNKKYKKKRDSYNKIKKNLKKLRKLQL